MTKSKIKCLFGFHECSINSFRLFNLKVSGVCTNCGVDVIITDLGKVEAVTRYLND